MTHLSAALLLGIVALPAGSGEIEHRTRIDHRSGAVEAEYRATIAVSTRQVGSVAAPGKASTLACAWQAGIQVERVARHASGSLLRRSVARTNVAEGRHAGWCGTQRAAIDREVARRGAAMRDHLLDVAREDRPVLHGEIDRLHPVAG